MKRQITDAISENLTDSDLESRCDFLKSMTLKMLRIVFNDFAQIFLGNIQKNYVQFNRNKISKRV